MSKLACGGARGIVGASSVQAVEKEECDAGVVLGGTLVLPVLLLLWGHGVPFGKRRLEDVVPDFVELFVELRHCGELLCWRR